MVPSFARTPIFAGETNHPWFVTPLLEPETVAEAVVEQVLMGVGRDCYLPGFVGVMPWVVWLSLLLLMMKKLMLMKADRTESDAVLVPDSVPRCCCENKGKLCRKAKDG